MTSISKILSIIRRICGWNKKTGRIEFIAFDSLNESLIMEGGGCIGVVTHNADGSYTVILKGTPAYESRRAAIEEERSKTVITMRPHTTPTSHDVTQEP